MENQTRKKRIKTVFNSSQVCHVWASQTQEYGRNSQNNIYFHGTEIYSYGSHYLMAKIYPEYGNAVLVNNQGYSNTTTRHRSNCYSAIGHLESFSVSDPSNPLKSINDMGDALTENMFDKLFENKPWFGYDSNFKNKTAKQWADDYFSEYNKLCDTFNYPKLKLSFPSDLAEIIGEYVEFRKQRNNELETTAKVRKANADLAKAKAEIRAKYQYEKSQNFVNDQQAEIKCRLDEKQYMAAWLSGESVNRYNLPCTKLDLIRVKDNKVETTAGADVPLNHALKLLMAINNGTVKHGDRVGHFSFNRLDGGIVTIGCHQISLGQARHALKPYMLEVVK